MRQCFVTKEKGITLAAIHRHYELSVVPITFGLFLGLHFVLHGTAFIRDAEIFVPIATTNIYQPIRHMSSRYELNNQNIFWRTSESSSQFLKCNNII